MGFYVYALQDVTGKRVYIGQCGSLEKRLEAHNAGYVKSTRSDRPWTLVAFQIVEERKEARWIEHELKKSRGKRSRWLQNHAVTLGIHQ